MRRLVGLVLALVPLGCGVHGESKGEDAPLGFSEQALNTPTCLTLQRGASGAVADAQIASDKPTTHYGSKTAANVNGGAVVRQLLLRFDLGAVPASSIVTSASLTLSGYQSTFGATSTLRVHKILAPWAESTVTWALFNGSFSPLVEASAINNRSLASPISFNVKSLVQGWVSGAFANQGLLLEQQEATISGLGTSESASLTNRPKLEVCYVPDTGQSSTAMVSAGGVSKSGQYTLVHAFGQSTQNQGKATSAQYRLRGGIVGENGSTP